MKGWLLGIWLTISVGAFAQERKMPPFTFQANSTEFANANRTYSSSVGFTETDTLSDNRILESLMAILLQNPDLTIELAGHISLGESEELGMLRAQKIKDALIAGGVVSQKVMVVNLADNEPVISPSALRSLPTDVERNAAHQRNRRVEVRVTSIE